MTSPERRSPDEWLSVGGVLTMTVAFGLGIAVCGTFLSQSDLSTRTQIPAWALIAVVALPLSGLARIGYDVWKRRQTRLRWIEALALDGVVAVFSMPAFVVGLSAVAIPYELEAVAAVAGIVCLTWGRAAVG